MLNNVNVVIQSSMDSPTEDEILNAIYVDGEVIDNIDDDFDDDDDIVILDNNVSFDFNVDISLENETVPIEINEYVTSIETQAKRLEQELEECDDLLGYDPHSSKPKPDNDNTVMVYDELQELKEAADEAGMTVEEFREKLLKDIDDDDFNEETMDNEFQEISELQTELEEARLEIKKLNDDLDEEVNAFLDDRVKRLQGLPMAIEEGNENSAQDGENTFEKNSKEDNNTQNPELMLKHLTTSQDEHKAGPVVIASEFTDFREFIRTQLRKTESKAEERRTQLRKMFDVQHQREEEKLLKEEEHKRDFRHQHERQAEILLARKVDEEKRIEEEIKINEKYMEKEYNSFQANLEELNAAYEEEKHAFETMKKSMIRELSERRNKAAVNIQKVYKGHRTRCLMRAAIQELAEMKELRKNEKEQIRVMEIQYEMDLRAEQEKKEKEGREQREEEEKKKEEEDRIAEEMRKETEKRLKEEKEEEEKRRKEEELARKEEEKQRKEEELRQREEEKKRKEEEKRQEKEERKRKQEEEKKRKEEEKRIKEEEEKKKKEEENRRKEEAKLKVEEDKRRKKEKEEEKKLLKSENKQSGLSDNKVGEDKESTEDKNTNSFKNNNSSNTSLVTEGNESIDDRKVCEKKGTQNENSNALLENGNKAMQSNNTGVSEQLSTEKIAPAFDVSHSPGTLSPHPPSSPCPKSHDSTTAPTRNRTIGPNKKSTPEENSAVSEEPTLSDRELVSLKRDLEKLSNETGPVTPKEPSSTELLRLSWMKHCIPWSKVSNEPWKLSQTSTAKMVKRPTSVKKKASPIPEQAVLTAAHAESLRQVSSVEFQDLPGYSLSTLSQCWNLRYLAVARSHLVCLDGLSACKHLLFIDAADNAIEYVDLKDLGSLQFLNLSRNKLGSIHGLQGCINLRWLDLGHNNIGKVAGLSSLRRLHTLNLSHNQVTSCEGLDEAVTIQELDLSHNFLQVFSGVNKLCLLTSLNLASNNLLQPPVLKNNVLLKWLYILENSLQSLAPLNQYWLPVLHCLDVSTNRLENLSGLENLPSLSRLEISHNQIQDVEGLRTCLESCVTLQSLNVDENPLVDVQDSEFRNLIVKMAPGLEELDGQSLGVKGQLSGPAYPNDSTATYLSQVKSFQRLKAEFESQAAKVQHKPTYNPEVLCSTTFHYCDTSFKMAVEHRSAHEYGDIHSPSSSSTTSYHVNNADNSLMSATALVPSPVSGNSFSEMPVSSAKSHKVNNIEEFTKVNNHPTPRKSLQNENMDAINFKNENSMSKSKFDSFLASSDEQKVHRNNGTGTKQHQLKAGHGHTLHNNIDLHSDSNCSKSSLGKTKHHEHVYNSDDEIDDKDDSDESDGLVDVTKDVGDKGDGTSAIGIKSVETNSKSCHKLPAPQQPQSYLSEKDKFLMALQGESGGGTTCHIQGNHGNEYGVSGYNNTSHRASLRGEDGVGRAHQSSTSSHNKNLFEAALSKDQVIGSKGQGHTSGVKADVVGAYMEHVGDEKFDIQGTVLDDNLADTFDFDSPDFDLEKYLDIGELDEFLEKGWRPQESPQIPSSNYPVLGKINHHNHKSQKPPQPPPSSSDKLQLHHHHHQQQQQHHQQSPLGFPYTTPPPPPSNPQQAWNNDLHHTSNINNNSSNRQQHLFSPEKGIPFLPNPSPSPSSVASAAETLGGGSVKSKRKDELCEEWGFKDGRTAELMLARARKMKYNSEKKKKLSKLNPQQRYQLFQKLEESGKIQPIRSRPAKVLPRKEYFQAREEEVQRQEYERVQEEKAKVNRTFEWLHTQVGDYQISSSRINPGSGPVYTSKQDMAGNGLQSSDHRQISPSSDSYNNYNSKMTVDDYGTSSALSQRRYSLGNGSNSRSPLLPPITLSSAPSQNNHYAKKEKMSFRNEPVELSGGWGGGKKRSGKNNM